jgi:hypothetical protein
MTRSFDTISNEAERPAPDMQKPSAPVMSVCPFCGAIAEKSEAPCPRCKMENSALTRQATRARIGPWYVMQSKNPSAPGMKCNTLLALIRKGQVTPRSVIRGPTTFQLWRFAARVKGISREFGLCYSCGAELQRTSTFCPRCSRSQELPPNPDVLLENEPAQPAAKTPVFREVNPRPATPDISTATESLSRTSSEPEPLRATRQQSQIPSAAQTMAELAELPSPHNAPPELQSRPRQRPQEGVLTPRELAAAFSLQYDPTMDVSAAGRSRHGGAGKSFLSAAAILLAIGGGVAVFWYNPSLRQRFMNWVRDSTPTASSTPIQSQAAKPAPNHAPDWMMNVPTDVNPIPAPKKDSANNSSLAQASVGPINPAPVNPTPVSPPPIISTAPQSSQSYSNQANTSQGNSSQGNPNQANLTPSSPAPSQSNYVPPAPAPRVPPADAQNTTATPQDPRIASAADEVLKRRQTDAGDLDQLAMDLRNDGLDAEHKQDYFSAQYYYQQVESLSRDHWPQDIDQLLKDAHSHLSSSDAGQ